MMSMESSHAPMHPLQCQYSLPLDQLCGYEIMPKAMTRYSLTFAVTGYCQLVPQRIELDYRNPERSAGPIMLHQTLSRIVQKISHAQK